MNEEMYRVGRFKISWYQKTLPLKDLYKLMGKCIILRAEHLVYEGVIEYVAISPYFDIVPENQIEPSYKWVFDGREWTARREDLFRPNEVQAMIEKAVKSVPARVIIKQRGRGWK